MRVNRESFLTKLAIAKIGLTNKELIQQSSFYVFKEGKLHTFNGEIACSCDSELDRNLEFAIEPGKFVDILNKLTDKSIGITIEDSQLIIAHGKSERMGLPIKDEVELPLDKIEAPKEWKPLSTYFCTGVDLVKECVSKNEKAGVYTYINVTPKSVEATDDCQVARYKVRTPIEESVLVKGRALAGIVPLGATEVSDGDSFIHFRNEDGIVISCAKYVDDFPDISEIMEKTGKAIPFPKGLDVVVGRSEVFTKDSENGEMLIELMPNGKIRLKAKSDDGSWYRKTKLIKYNGEKLVFMITPKILLELSHHQTECLLCDNLLKVEEGKFTFVTAISNPNSRSKTKEE